MTKNMKERREMTDEIEIHGKSERRREEGSLIWEGVSSFHCLVK